MNEKYQDTKKYHFFKSFFITKLLDEEGYSYNLVKNWSRRVKGKNIFNLDKIFFPINHNNIHWSLAVIFIPEKRIQIFDSGGNGGQRYLDGLLQYLKDEMRDKHHMEGKWNGWNLIPSHEKIPKQLNGDDCGVFTCMFAYYIAEDLSLTFDQTDVTEFRKHIAMYILKKRIE